VWSYDFVEAQTHDGRKLRLMTLIDEYTRDCLAIRVARRINSFGVLETMADVMLIRGVPEHIRSDNGAEMTAKVVRNWLTQVAQLRFAAVSEVPTPWVCHQHDLREIGISPEAIKRVSDRTMAENYASLRKGELEVMQAFEPFVSMAEMDHAGKLLYAASSRGPTVYTAFIATRVAIARQREVFVAMTRALAKMEQWLYVNSAEELGNAIAPFFAHVPKDILVPSLQRCRDAGLWARNPEMSKQGFNRLGLSFVSGGLLQRSPVYDDCVEQNLS
jgi:NitT/TauT family transport system substrate-binding protein